MLREILRLLLVHGLHLAALRGRLGAHQELQKRGLACAVRAHDADLVAHVDVEVRVLEQHLVHPVPVPVRHPLQARQGLDPSAAPLLFWRLWELEKDPPRIARWRVCPIVGSLHLLKLPDLVVARLRHHLLPLVLLDECLHGCDLFLLQLPSLLPLSQSRVALINVLGVVALVGVGHAVDGLDHPLADPVHELAVVRHQRDGQGLLLQEALEPLDARQVQVVRRLVQKQDVGGGHEDLGEADADLPTSREQSHLPVHVVLQEAHRVHDRCDPRLELVHAQLLGLLLQPRQFLDRLTRHLPAVLAGLVHLRFELLQSLVDASLLGHRGHQLLHDRTIQIQLVDEALSEDGHLDLRIALYDLAGLRRQLPHQHPELRRLPAAVRAHEGHALARADVPRGVLDDHPPPHPHRDLLQTDPHFAGHASGLKIEVPDLGLAAPGPLDELPLHLVVLLPEERLLLVVLELQLLLLLLSLEAGAAAGGGEGGRRHRRHIVEPVDFIALHRRLLGEPRLRRGRGHHADVAQGREGVLQFRPRGRGLLSSKRRRRVGLCAQRRRRRGRSEPFECLAGAQRRAAEVRHTQRLLHLDSLFGRHPHVQRATCAGAIGPSQEVPALCQRYGCGGREAERTCGGGGVAGPEVEGDGEGARWGAAARAGHRADLALAEVHLTGLHAVLPVRGHEHVELVLPAGLVVLY
mmetsp:Transcript_97372/g.245711  ORF Transcript_97372/g.245711 Transcript_97372/m.245711 type:complete len:692 (-) Transcript_97372:727-2802(-)